MAHAVYSTTAATTQRSVVIGRDLTMKAAIEKYRRESLASVLFSRERKRASVLEELERECPGILDVQCDPSGAVILK